jgi:hypothetical protein
LSNLSQSPKANSLFTPGRLEGFGRARSDGVTGMGNENLSKTVLEKIIKMLSFFVRGEVSLEEWSDICTADVTFHLPYLEASKFF